MMSYRLLPFLIVSIVLWNCNSTPPMPEIGVEEFIVPDGYKIELVASEPLLQSPVEIEIDEKGRIWAVEMTGYMRDIEGSEEEKPDGAIVILEDTDGDGRMDKRIPFLDSLVIPRAIALVYDGLLYVESPKLWWVPIKDGNKPGAPVLVDSTYAYGGNIEHKPNGLYYNIDNWIYSAKSNVRYQMKNGEWKREVTAFRGQWGITSDLEGRLYSNSNSSMLRADHLFPATFLDNPYFKSRLGTNQFIAENNRLYPLQATSINRGYVDGNLDEEGKALTGTSVCGPLIYKGDLLGETMVGEAFVCTPEINAVKHLALFETDGRIMAKNTTDSLEFLVSKDESFRPVNLYNGPEGAMYIVDMRKGIIQHRAYMSQYLRNQILNKGLDSIVGMGRVYRLIKETEVLRPTEVPVPADDNEWIALLQHNNFWHRQFAQKHLVHHFQPGLIPNLEQVAMDQDNPVGQLHALWTLDGGSALTSKLLMDVLSNTQDAKVWKTGIHLLEQFSADLDSKSIVGALQNGLSLKDSSLSLQLSHSAGHFFSTLGFAAWYELFHPYMENELFVDALISSLAGKEKMVLDNLPAELKAGPLGSKLKEVIGNIEQDNVQKPAFVTSNALDGRTRGMTLYSQNCGNCHGQDGMGLDGVAPPLYLSEYVNGPGEQLVMIVLHGLQGPITVKGKTYDETWIMPGIKDNPNLKDDDIARILSFLKNGFSDKPGRVRSSMVAKIREQTKDREQMLTADELAKWMAEKPIIAGQ